MRSRSRAESNKKIALTVFVLVCLSMTMLSYITVQLRASEEGYPTITIDSEGIHPEDAKKKFEVVDKKIYRLKEDITFKADGILIKVNDTVLDLSKHTIEGKGTGVGVGCKSQSGVTIMNGTIRNFDFCITLEQKSSRINVTSNVISHSFYGVQIRVSGYIDVMGNEISHSEYAAVLISQSKVEERMGHISVTGNKIFNSSRYGIQVEYSDHINVSDNEIVLNLGIGAEGGASAYIDYTSFVNFTGNTILDSADFGVEFENSDNSTVTNNTISNSSIAIGNLGGENNTVSDNKISNSKKDAVKIEEGGSNIICNNSITSNTEDGIHLLRTPNNRILNNSLTSNAGAGIKLEGSSGNNISHNTASNNSVGINCTNSGENSIIDNNVTLNQVGISLSSCTMNNMISRNVVANNEKGIIIENSDSITISSNDVTSNKNLGISIQNSSYNTIFNNTVTWNNATGIRVLRVRYNNISGNNITLNMNGRGIALLQSSNNNISGDGISHNAMQGIWMDESSTYNAVTENNVYNNTEGGICLSNATSNNTIYNNTITSNAGLGGVWLNHTATGNSIVWNNVSKNNIGICIIGSENKIYYNNLVNNTDCQAICTNQTNQWDDDHEGNYWSDYTCDDLDRDGIGDTPYNITDNAIKDRYPLMGSFTIFTVEVKGVLEKTVFHITLISNSTVVPASFNLDLELNEVSFNLTGLSGAAGFCRVAIPKELLSVPFQVLIDNSSVGYTVTLPDTYSPSRLRKTHSYLHFTYHFKPNNTLNVRINGTTKFFFKIPEDVNDDGVVNILDIAIVAKAYGSKRGDPNYNADADVAEPYGEIDIIDISKVARKYPYPKSS